MHEEFKVGKVLHKFYTLNLGFGLVCFTSISILMGHLTMGNLYLVTWGSITIGDFQAAVDNHIFFVLIFIYHTYLYIVFINDKIFLPELHFHEVFLEP